MALLPRYPRNPSTLREPGEDQHRAGDDEFYIRGQCFMLSSDDIAVESNVSVATTVVEL